MDNLAIAIASLSPGPSRTAGAGKPAPTDRSTTGSEGQTGFAPMLQAANDEAALAANSMEKRAGARAEKPDSRTTDGQDMGLAPWDLMPTEKGLPLLPDMTAATDITIADAMGQAATAPVADALVATPSPRVAEAAPWQTIPTMPGLHSDPIPLPSPGVSSPATQVAAALQSGGPVADGMLNAGTIGAASGAGHIAASTPATVPIAPALPATGSAATAAPMPDEGLRHVDALPVSDTQAPIIPALTAEAGKAATPSAAEGGAVPKTSGEEAASMKAAPASRELVAPPAPTASGGPQGLSSTAVLVTAGSAAAVAPTGAVAQALSANVAIAAQDAVSTPARPIATPSAQTESDDSLGQAALLPGHVEQKAGGAAPSSPARGTPLTIKPGAPVQPADPTEAPHQELDAVPQPAAREEAKLARPEGAGPGTMTVAAPPPQQPVAVAPAVAIVEPPRAAPHASPLRQVAPAAVALAAGTREGETTTLSVSLDPAELGRVEINVERQGGQTVIRVTAERGETLALLQRDQRDLVRSLDQAGLSADGGFSMNFSLSGQGAGQRQGHQQPGQQGWGGDGRVPGPIIPRTAIAPEPGAARAKLSLLDLDL